MANLFQLDPKISALTSGLLVGRMNAYPLLRSGFVKEADFYAGRGGTVRIRIPGRPGAEVAVNRNANYTTGEITETEAIIEVQRVNTLQVPLTVEDYTLNIRNLTAQFLEPHSVDLAAKIDEYVYSQALVNQPYHTVGTSTYKEFAAPSRVLNKNRSASSRRSAILGPDAAYEWETLDSNHKANEAGRAGGIAANTFGFLSRKGDTDYFVNNEGVANNLHAAGTLGTNDDLVTAAAAAPNDNTAGQTTLAVASVVDPAGSTYKKGDLLSLVVAGKTYYFTVTADGASTGSAPTVANIPVSPALPVTFADDVVVTVVKPGQTYEKSLVFDQGYAAAIVLPTQQSDPANGTYSYRDPGTGLAFTIQQTKSSGNSGLLTNMEAYVGCVVVEPKRGCLLVG